MTGSKLFHEIVWIFWKEIFLLWRKAQMSAAPVEDDWVFRQNNFQMKTEGTTTVYADKD